jgi:hypothetical protein
VQIDRLDLVLEENSDLEASRSPNRYYLLSCLKIIFEIRLSCGNF